MQHLLSERIFRKIFDVGDFMQRNNIAAEIEKVVAALTIRSFSRDQFLRELDRFYKAIEDAAGTIQEFSEKQKFLNTVYEQFFQGFAVKRADAMGIVYTPQEIVNFILSSVEEILRTEFGRTLGDAGVHVIDPFVGTGNFLVNLMRRLPKTRLEYKSRNELHCNEVMLLPYYVSAMNIAHTFWERIGCYEPFPGICLVDTFETAEKAQKEFGFFNPENTERVKRQKAAPIFVVLGNPLIQLAVVLPRVEKLGLQVIVGDGFAPQGDGGDDRQDLQQPGRGIPGLDIWTVGVDGDHAASFQTAAASVLLCR